MKNIIHDLLKISHEDSISHESSTQINFYLLNIKTCYPFLTNTVRHRIKAIAIASQWLPKKDSKS